MIDIFIFIHFLFVLKMYLKEDFFGVKSIYAFSLFIFVFMAHVYLKILIGYFANAYESSWGLHLSLFLTSILISRIKTNGSQISNFLKLPISKKTIRRIFFLMVVTLGILFALNFIIGGHFLRFQTIGFFLCSVYFTSFLFHNRKKFGNQYINFAILDILIAIIFLTLFWSGYGRLLLLQFLSISLFFTSLLFKDYVRKIKLALFFMIPLLIGFGGFIRHADTLGEALQTGKGAGSVFSPLNDSEKIYNDINNKKIKPVNGESYVAAILFYIPRSIWTNKPKGFGHQMVKWYFPSYKDTGYSLAGLFIIEAYGNFSYIGLLIGPFLMFFTLKLIARNFNKTPTLYTYKKLFSFLMAIAFLCVIPDFVWGGLQPYLIRSTVSAFFIFLLYKMLKWTNSLSSI